MMHDFQGDSALELEMATKQVYRYVNICGHKHTVYQWEIMLGYPFKLTEN